MFERIANWRVRRSVLVIGACLALFAGTALAREYQLTSAQWLWLVVPFAVMSLRRHNLVTLLLLVVLFAGIGLWRGSDYMQKLAVYQDLSKEKVTLVGRATDDGVYGARSQLTFSVDHVQVAAPYRAELVGKVGVKGFGASSVNRGDVVRITGKLYPTRGNNQASVSFAQLEVLGRDSSPLEAFRHKFIAGMQTALPEPAASFGLGLLIGQRSTLPEHVSDQLLMVGLTHIIAVSGYNLTIIVRATQRLLSRLSKFQNTFICLSLIGVFLLITGSSPSIVRASIISVLGIAAWYYGRSIKPLVLLLVGAAITIIANPLYLWGNVSWYLSFLAFFGVLVLAPLVRRRVLRRKAELGIVATILLESLCAEIMTLPYVLFIFGELSTVSLLANVLVAALIPLAMLFSLFAGLAGMFMPAVAGWIAWPASQLLTYMLDTAYLLSRIPHAFVKNIGFSCNALLLSYGVVGFVCLVLWDKTRPKYGTITDKKQLQAEGA